MAVDVAYALNHTIIALDAVATAIERMPRWRKWLLGGPPLDAAWLNREVEAAERILLADRVARGG